MSYFGQGNSFLQPATSPLLKDYTHAAKTFLSNGYGLVPRFKFLFHVVFNINTAQIPQLQALYGSGNNATIGLMVKSVDLPKFKIDTTTLNQYNRKRLVQTKVHYEPSKITLHDDQDDTIRTMWYNYYTYYYGDPSKQYQGIPTTSGTLGQIATYFNGFSYNANDIYSNTLQNANWGFVGESPNDGTNPLFSVGSGGKPRFFNDITIYGMSQKTFAAWTMINPIIQSWNSDTYDYREGAGTMQHDVTIEYEAVKYYTGNIGAEQASSVVPGFADPAHYDTQASSITTTTGRNSVYHQGGMVGATQGSIADLQSTAKGSGALNQVLGAVQAATTVYNSFQSGDPSSVAGFAMQAAGPTQSLLNNNGIPAIPGLGSVGAIFADAPIIANNPQNNSAQANGVGVNGIGPNGVDISQGP